MQMDGQFSLYFRTLLNYDEHPWKHSKIRPCNSHPDSVTCRCSFVPGERVECAADDARHQQGDKGLTQRRQRIVGEYVPISPRKSDYKALAQNKFQKPNAA